MLFHRNAVFQGSNDGLLSLQKITSPSGGGEEKEEEEEGSEGAVLLQGLRLTYLVQTKKQRRICRDDTGSTST